MGLSFNKVAKEQLEITSIISNAFKQKEAFYVWYATPFQLIKANLEISTYRKRKKEIVFRPFPDSVHFLRQIISGKEKLNLYMTIQSYYFTISFKELNADGLLIGGWPEELTFYNRRKKPRSLPDNSRPIQVKFKTNEKVLLKNCYDIGTGGFSLVFSKSEHIEFQKDELLKKIEIKIEKSSILVNCRVKEFRKLELYLLENHPYGGQRAAFQFIDLDPKSLEKINKYLEEHRMIGANNEIFNHF